MTERETESVLRVEELVEHLARISGRELRVINLFSSSDIVDIVGSFEQISLDTKIDDLVTLLIKEFSEPSLQKTQEQKEVLGYLLGFKYCSKAGISQLIEKIQSLENLNLPAF